MNLLKQLLAALALVALTATSAQAACTDPAGPGVNWSGCNKNGIRVPGANLSGANLSNATFSPTAKYNADFSDADLRGANFTGSTLPFGKINFSNTKLSGAIWTDGLVCAEGSIGNCNVRAKAPSGSNTSTGSTAGTTPGSTAGTGTNTNTNTSTGTSTGSTGATTAKKVSYAVAGATLTAAQGDAIMKWIASERAIVTTAFCYRQSYDRGIGIAPDNCGPGKDARGQFCYDNCKAGFSDNGTPTCLQSSCPSGYTDNGLVCHFNGSSSYSPVRWDNNAGVCMFGGCTGGWVEDGCRSGYHKSASMCYLDVPAGMGGTSADPTKGSYTRPTKGSPGCNSNRVLQAGLCYLPAREGYSCNATNCNPACASGTVECGAAACAATAESCGRGITDMVVGPLQLIAFVGTAGAAGPVITATKAAAAAATKGVALGNDLATLQGILTKAVEDAMNAAENDLASITSDYVAAQVAARYPKGSANYRYIARRWVNVVMFMNAAHSNLDLALLAASMIDETGVTSTVIAYTKPPCFQHSPMP